MGTSAVFAVSPWATCECGNLNCGCGNLNCGCGNLNCGCGNLNCGCGNLNCGCGKVASLFAVSGPASVPPRLRSLRSLGAAACGSVLRDLPAPRLAFGLRLRC
ncbi:MAG: hypothetical protein IJ131_10645 [Eggerthellaceae bacterium]|nr:hypothetical protein [Eggerthellaceae bacterium]